MVLPPTTPPIIQNQTTPPPVIPPIQSPAPQPTTNKKLLAIIIVTATAIILAITFSYIAYEKYQTKKNQETTQDQGETPPLSTAQNQEINRIKQILDSSQAEQPSSTPKLLDNGKTAYQVTISIPESTDWTIEDTTGFLSNVFSSTNNIVSSESISSIATKKSQDSSPNNRTYYIVINNLPKLKNEYNYQNTKITTQILQNNLIPHLEDPKFCETNSDCTLRYNFCMYGAYNQFHPYRDIWGCGPPSDETGYTFDIPDPGIGCTTSTVVTYSHATCDNNKCTANNRSVSCKE